MSSNIKVPRKAKTALGRRAYIPKIRGCHECSQRRIDCDRTQPDCVKCTDRGLRCSGFGIRYRFRDDVASKSRTCGKNESRHPSHLRDQILGTAGNEFRVDQTSHAYAEEDQETYDSQISFGQCFCSPELQGRTNTSISLRCSATPHRHVMLASGYPQTCMIEDPISVSTNTLHSFESWKEYLLVYFSDHIALELVVIDDQSNGWRHLILPVARLDDLVRDAVLAASAFHFSGNVDEHLFEPSLYYQKAIQRLRQRQNLDLYDAFGKQAVLLALLVLLSAVMVSGNSDFRTLFKLLEAALVAAGGEETLLVGELGTFLLKQIRKFRGYVAPFISQLEGVSTLSLTGTVRPSASEGWQCFRSYYYSYPKFANHMDTLYDLNEQACNIYVTRAMARAQDPPLTDLVDQFKTTLETIPNGSPGEHILVWSIFLAAAESSTPDHKKYFTDALCRHGKRNGFANVFVALDQLRRIWARPVDQNWTEVLAKSEAFIV